MKALINKKGLTGGCGRTMKFVKANANLSVMPALCDIDIELED